MAFFASQRFHVPISLARRLILLRDSAMMTAHLARTHQAQSDTTLFRHIAIPHESRSLETVYATPISPAAAILLFHGIGERLDYWEAVQHLLAEHKIASLVFHYSGFGNSTGATTSGNLHLDAHAAYATLRSLLPESIPVSLLGFSLGTGVATDAAAHLSPPPAGLILCQAFTSLRAAAAAIASPLISPLLPDIWQTHANIAAIQMPRLIVHGDADRLFPTWMAQQIASAAQAGSDHFAALVQPSGFSHSDAYLRPKLDYWQLIIDFAHQAHLSQKTS